MVRLNQRSNNSLHHGPYLREIPADLETPVSIYLKLKNEKPSFLLESVTGGEQLGRYSFIGINPQDIYVLRNNVFEHFNGETVTYYPINPGEDPLAILREKIETDKTTNQTELPRFWGGLVGFMGYEIARMYEKTLSNGETNSDDETPDAIFLYCETVVAFDHAYGKLLIITNLPSNPSDETAHQQAQNQIDEIEELINTPLTHIPNPGIYQSNKILSSNMTLEQFTDAVKKAKEYILSGDIFQVVLSQRFSRKTSADPFSIYRSLRRINPSPYMFFLDFGNSVTKKPFQIIGASPEMHVRLEGQIASIHPIAGTRARGKNLDEDILLSKDLLSDPKELAEHVMLVDLARNDLGRVCSYGSVKVTKMMEIENYSHVMHIVSNVEGELNSKYDCFDLLRATFPAGTVSGAPKIRAMQIISELEPDRRGPYAGAVGYFSFDGSMDTCITIRTLVMKGNEISVQAGAGIVADSIPENEYQESIHKAQALALAVAMAENFEYRVRKI